MWIATFARGSVRPCFYAILFVHMLCGIKLVILAFLCDKLVMSAALGNAFVVDIHYLIAVLIVESLCAIINDVLPTRSL